MGDERLTGESLEQAKTDFISFINFVGSLSEDELRAQVEALSEEDRAEFQAFVRRMKEVFGP